MKKNILSAVLIVVFFVLQTTIFRTLAIGSIVPNILIILTASSGFMRGKKTGLLVGFFSGLLIDIFFGEAIGFYALIYMYIGFANGFFERIFYPEDIKLPMILITISDLSYGLICYILTFLLRSRFQFGYYFVHIILPEMVYTIAVTIILYPLILWLNKLFDDTEKRSAKKIV